MFFTLINSVDPDEMQHLCWVYAAFHLGLHCTHLGVSQVQRVEQCHSDFIVFLGIQPVPLEFGNKSQ